MADERTEEELNTGYPIAIPALGGGLTVLLFEVTLP